MPINRIFSGGNIPDVKNFHAFRVRFPRIFEGKSGDFLGFFGSSDGANYPGRVLWPNSGRHELAKKSHLSREAGGGKKLLAGDSWVRSATFSAGIPPLPLPNEGDDVRRGRNWALRPWANSAV